MAMESLINPVNDRRPFRYNSLCATPLVVMFDHLTLFPDLYDAVTVRASAGQRGPAPCCTETVRRGDTGRKPATSLEKNSR